MNPPMRSFRVVARLCVPVVGLGLLAACFNLNQPMLKPWYAEIVPDQVQAARLRFDSTDTLHILGFSGADLVHGTFDDGADRSTSYGPAIRFEQAGSPFTPVEAVPLTSNRVDMAIRPGSDDVWVMVDGRAGPLGDDGVVDLTVEHLPNMGQVQSDVNGTLVFVDADTLWISVERGLPAAWLEISLDGDLPVGEPEVLDIRGTEWSGCDADLARTSTGDIVWAQGCDGLGPLGFSTEVLGPDGWITNTNDAQENHVEGPPRFVGVSDDHGMQAGLANTRVMCPSSFGPNGLLQHREDKHGYESGCFGSAASVGNVVTGDTRSDGQQFVLATTTPGLLVLDERKPPGAGGSVAGVWCDGTNTLGLQRGEPPTFNGPYSTIYNQISWSQSGETLTVTFNDPVFESNDPYKHQSWVRRVGDVLHVKGGKTLDDADRITTTGDPNTSGIYTRCGE